MTIFRVLLFLMLLFPIGNTIAGELVLTGVYQGKSLFVQNPFNAAENAFCTKAVYVNDRMIYENPVASAFKIDLSFLNLRDIVVVKLIYRDGCEPKIVNPQVLQKASEFGFLYQLADNNSIEWSTEGEEAGGEFTVEQRNDTIDWQTYVKVNAKGDFTNNQYRIVPEHWNGDNDYRIRYENLRGKVAYSTVFSFKRVGKLITFYPTNVVSKITLSEDASYSISNRNGRIIKSGQGRLIFVNDLKPGVYFLHIQNRKEKFIKK